MKLIWLPTSASNQQLAKKYCLAEQVFSTLPNMLENWKI
jgi:hypothetical protein